MSHIVSVDFQHIFIECTEVCESIVARIAELQKLFVEFEQASKGAIDEQDQSLVRSFEREVMEWLCQVHSIREAIQIHSDQGRWIGDSDSTIFRNRYQQIDLAYALRREVNRRVATSIPAIRALISQMYDARIKRLMTMNKKEGQHSRAQQTENVELSCEQSRAPQSMIGRLLASIDDATQREFTYMAYVLNPHIEKAELLQAGKRMYDTAMENERQKLLDEELRKQKLAMESIKMPQEDIDKALAIQGTTAQKIEQLYGQTSEAIVKEKMRKESLKIILKAIKSQGFVVPLNDIVRQGEQVVVRAHKIGGQVAKFTINLDGKFIYDFQGYEGQACQNDIEPFLKDLEEIYGAHLINRQEIWKNPDKIQNKKMQVANTKKDKM